MSDIQPTSALKNHPPIKSDISIFDVDDLGMIDLRGDLADKEFVAAIKKALGCSLPKTPRTSTVSKNITCLWLSPDQWLITCSQNETEKLLSALNKALENIHSFAVNVSDMRSVIRLEGDGVKETIMKGSSVDLTLVECKKGFVRRLLFAEQAALIHITSDTPEIIDLYVFRSYGDYVWKWLKATSNPATRIRLFTKQSGV